MLHIWDLQFGILLTSYNLLIPASLDFTSALHLSLVADQENLSKPPPKTEIFPNSQVSNQAYLLVSSMLPSRKETSGAKKESKITSVVFVIPYTVPRFSTIAAAMGRGAMSQRWLQDDHSADKTTLKNAKKFSEDLPNGTLLLDLQTALQEGRTQAAEAMFLKWTSTIKEKEEETVRSLGLYSGTPIDTPYHRQCLGIISSKNFLPSSSHYLRIFANGKNLPIQLKSLTTC
jgi:hypothetical protein